MYRFKNLFIIWSVQGNQSVELLCKSKTFALATHQIKIYALLEFPIWFRTLFSHPTPMKARKKRQERSIQIDKSYRKYEYDFYFLQSHRDDLLHTSHNLFKTKSNLFRLDFCSFANIIA